MDSTKTIITAEQIYNYTMFYTISIRTLLQSIITVERIYSYTTFYAMDIWRVTEEQIYSYTTFLRHGYTDSTTTYHHCKKDLQL